MFELRKTGASNHAILMENGSPIGVREDNRTYMVGDLVTVSPDSQGYISPGIRTPGIGVIYQINLDYTDHYYKVRMISGESGSIKSARISQVLANN